LTKKVRRWMTGVSFLALSGAGIVQASDTVPSLMHSTADARAGKVLDNAYRYIESLKSFSFKAVLTNEDIYEGKMVVELTHQVEVRLKRPENLRIDITGDSRNRSYYIHRAVLTIFDRGRKFYAETNVPQTIDGALDFAYEHYRVQTPLANILYSDLLKRLKPKVQGYYFGVTYIGNTLCDYIGFSDEKKSFQVWVAKGSRPLIRKYVIIDKTNPMRLHSSVLIDWDSDVKISDKIFQFTPDKKVKKIGIFKPEGAGR